MDQLDDIIHQPVRLKIMAALNALPSRESIDFVRLRAIVEATEGNLGAHLATLEKSGYIEMEKGFVGKKPRTSIAMTPSGRLAFERYVSHLRGILDGAA
ncbi:MULTISPECIES: transcriptional regulator [Paraburkholderia]|uniref:Transcriptional regulator n=1 Tax=Paraburkholderia megapolitana TaxID=420953 RepID=A0A1I3ITV9_9BURK|nr:MULTISPECIES: transcriptional regulator [Paraburkholderia]MCX4160998.1 transcriptional regulator [Paraburkholderia megapolitana]MDN7156494.1 transcriptional regulator [Paraburkholderia sp. CHISQ3]MDQ6493539.1 transcriptional regulator [Paraburkholderia megapolitana]QDQ85052.1 transcriptional regulator [Paraburkholderia megapolitana]SFI51356.1 transcriptional regulator [Paraburkholderia megapolitana]